ncbi:MAG: hypothetical protein Q4Q23_03340 [Methanobacteriaceae archaeon]|nr:hypothetical protein [Methanobacteriaceae archaeon]
MIFTESLLAVLIEFFIVFSVIVVDVFFVIVCVLLFVAKFEEVVFFCVTVLSVV